MNSPGLDSTIDIWVTAGDVARVPPDFDFKVWLDSATHDQRSLAEDVGHLRAFADVFRHVRNQWGDVAARRLVSLHGTPAAAGEHSLRLASVLSGLRFLQRYHWPFSEAFVTPAGELQLVWRLEGFGLTLAARFLKLGGLVSFAVGGTNGVKLSGAQLELGEFAEVVSHLKGGLPETGAHGGEAQTSGTADTWTGYGYQVLFTDTAVSGRESITSGLSATTTG